MLMKILFVCTGNTCRSPMAAALLERIIKERNLKNIEVSSAGIAANNSSPASKNAIDVCEKIGIDLSEHISRSIFDINLASVDKFAVMTTAHKNALLRLSVPVDKIYILGDEILDPFGGDVKVYERCKNQIEAALYELLDKLEMKTE